MESFFATLKCELLDRRKFKTKAEARVACFEFIEGWYNHSQQTDDLSDPLILRGVSLSTVLPAAEVQRMAHEMHDARLDGGHLGKPR